MLIIKRPEMKRVWFMRLSKEHHMMSCDYLTLAPKPMPRVRASLGVPKRSAPCPPGSRSPKQPHERSRPKTPDFEVSYPTRRTKHRPVTMARSVYNIDEPVIPIPRKRIHSVKTVSIFP